MIARETYRKITEIGYTDGNIWNESLDPEESHISVRFVVTRREHISAFCSLMRNSVGTYNFQLAQRSVLERGLSVDISRISKKFRKAFVRFASNTARLVSTSVSTSLTAACYLRRVLLARVTGG